ncbi:zf-HC2 domain-containing protein [Dermatophilaceae bacterium Soc4.6]
MTRHVGAQLSAYVDGCLGADAQREIDRHLVACQVCRHAVDQERKLLLSLRFGATPRLSEGLQASLLSLASGLELTPLAVSPASRTAQVPTVSPRRPGLHRSPRRAAGLAGFAATASAAAAIGLAVAGPAVTPLRTPPARPAGSVSGAVSVSLVGQASAPAPAPATVVADASLLGATQLSSASTVRPVGAALWTRTTTRGR